jgi:hypothetical protein
MLVSALTTNSFVKRNFPDQVLHIIDAQWRNQKMFEGGQEAKDTFGTAPREDGVGGACFFFFLLRLSVQQNSFGSFGAPRRSALPARKFDAAPARAAACRRSHYGSPSKRPKSTYIH